MKSNIYLTSSVHLVADSIGKKLEAKNNNVKLLFIDTGAELEIGDKKWMEDDKKALLKAGFILKNYTISKKQLSEIKNELEAVDVRS